MNKLALQFTLNGKPVDVNPPTDARLLDVLRDDCGHTGTKEGCGEGECGSCTVLLDGLPVNACLVPAFQVQGREVWTAESASQEIAEALNRRGTAQCGACTSGIVMSIEWLRRHPDLAAKANLRDHMAGHLCRCTGYDAIMEGARDVLGDDTDEEES